MSDPPTPPEDMTIAELQHEIGKLQSILFRKVGGDPTKSFDIGFDNSCLICGKDHGGTPIHVLDLGDKDGIATSYKCEWCGMTGNQRWGHAHKCMEREIRIFDPLHKFKGGKNYYRFMTAIGPCFGGTIKDAAVMKAGEFLDLSRRWPMGCLWEIEDAA